MSTPHIIIVEDKAIIAKDIQATLEKAGYHVPAIASSGETALKKVAELRPDLVLMDIRLKGQMDGVEAAAQVRERFGIPVIFLTAHADSETLGRAISTDPFGYILKPFEERELQVAIQVALYKHDVERKLKTQERWLSATLESIGDAVLTTDPKGNIISLNPVAQTLTGWTQSEAKGRNITDILTIVDENSKTPVTNPLFRALQTGTAAGLNNPALLVLKDGREIPIDDIATPIRDTDNSIIGGVIVIRDVRQTRQLEEQLRQAQKLEAVGQLAAGMAHNFNNMLTVISLYVNIVMNMLPEDHAAHARLQRVDETTGQAADMIQRLLAFARRQIVQPELLKLNEQLLKINDMLRHALPETVELKVMPQAAQDWVKIDPGQLEQVIMNLILNARDALPDGGQITVQTSNITLEQPLVTLPSGVPAGKYVLLTVQDNGRGMSRETVSHIFEPFFTTKEVGSGAGLGLSTCLGIVEQNYGRITIDSQPGQGSIFHVYLPLHKPTTPLPTGITTEQIWPGRETILVVEDDAEIREAIVLSLREYGYTVFEANNGTNALRLVETQIEQSIHLLITDVVMPDMGGKSLANLLKLTFDDLKVLFISGYPDMGTVPPGTAFLAKPFSPQTLAQKVRELLASE